GFGVVSVVSTDFRFWHLLEGPSSVDHVRSLRWSGSMPYGLETTRMTQSGLAHVSNIRPRIEQREYLICCTHVAEDHSDRSERRIVLLIRTGRISIRDHNALVIHHHAVAQCALAADVCGRSHND